MIANILTPLRPEQVRVLIEHHQFHAAHASTLPDRHDHLRDAEDLRRRLTDHAERSEAPA